MSVNNSSSTNPEDEQFQKELELAVRLSLMTYENEQKQRGVQRRSSQPESVISSSQSIYNSI